MKGIRQLGWKTGNGPHHRTQHGHYNRDDPMDPN